jgi:hypothetical protein
MYVYNNIMPKKIQQYTSERQSLVNKMLKILEINETNNILSLKKLDEDQQKQQQIINLIDDIKQYFICSSWTFFSNKKRKIKRLYLSLIKSVMKEMNVQMISSTRLNKTDEKVQNETFYIFLFKNI